MQVATQKFWPYVLSSKKSSTVIDKKRKLTKVRRKFGPMCSLVKNLRLSILKGGNWEFISNKGNVAVIFQKELEIYSTRL